MNQLVKKANRMDRLSNSKGIIAALAIDQRGALKKMMEKIVGRAPTDSEIMRFKEIVSEELTPYTSAILLDPEYGIKAATSRDQHAGLIIAYEKTGYDQSVQGRLPDLLNEWSVHRLKEFGADAVKVLLYYDVDEETAINQQKQAFVERIGGECRGEEIPFYLELLAYDKQETDSLSLEFAKKKPEKVIQMMKEFSKDCYQVDVLKVEVPVNMAYVEGFSTGAIAYSKKQAKEYFKQQAEATKLPFIFLSGGVDSDLFQQTLYFAKAAGSTFNGILCGRATWAEGVRPFMLEGEEAGREWLRTVGVKKLKQLNKVLGETAEPLG